ncbi:SRPBCC family protein [Evansella sp. LMS18]|uniref:SRPBCC family protein n=1 Tax=Evansella sp. LMS18 TaxID=2924033 RepID=UPI0020D1E2EB|nr:SRPBCC family protein [Evansella sp. LMS18]UTR10271.1 SRPBCC family protein [Evansella sp. LMS18]
MSNYGRLYEKEGREVLVFERTYPFAPDKVFRFVTEPDYFTRWYPFATGDMDLRVGGKIKFDDGEGSVYEGVITEFKPPYSFSFREIDDMLEMQIQETEQGCSLTFRHTFDDRTMAMYTAAGWHRCLDVLGQLIHGRTIEWKDNALELREYYKTNL